MADTLKIKKQPGEQTRPDERAAAEAERKEAERKEAECKDDRPAGLRLQVFTPPPFDEGPLWGTNPEGDAAPEGVSPPASNPPSGSLRTRQVFRVALLAAVGGLLVTAGMIISKLHGPASPALSAATPPPAASAPAVLAGDAGTLDRASDAAAKTAGSAAAPASKNLASARPPARMAPPAATRAETTGPKDASVPPEPKDAAPGKKLILTDAPF